MTNNNNSSSPCGACKFLRRKCARGCIFAPYFCHEQGSTHFAAIHKVFGASNAAKILGHLPVSDRSEAVVTISYEAQARVQDPIYGCVSHIFSLQQQVVSLQAQLASLKQESSNYNGNNDNSTSQNYPQDVQSWLQSEYQNKVPSFDSNINCNMKSSTIYGDHHDVSRGSYDGISSHHTIDSNIKFENQSDWTYSDTNDLHSMAFGYSQYS